MIATDSTPRERGRIAEDLERFFDDLYHMGRPAEIFETAPQLGERLRRPVGEESAGRLGAPGQSGVPPRDRSAQTSRAITRSSLVGMA